jgi:valyl-tRNA synthetase
LALNDIETFFWKNFCDNYLEVIKDQLFNPENYDRKTIEATQWTLYNVGLRILQMYAPYVPYITDTLYQIMYHQGNITSVHQTKFKDIQQPYSFEQSVFTTETLLDLVTHIRKLKTEHQLSLKTELASLTVYTDLKTATQIKEHEQLFKGITNAQTIVYKTEKIKKSYLKEKDGYWHGAISY